MWRATVLTIFPEMFPGPLGASLAGKASGRLWSLEAVDIRDYATDKHRSVDDTPAGGGAGMVMRADVIARAIDAAAADDATAPADEPARPPLDPGAGRALAAAPASSSLCGRFEGVDERVIAGRDLEEVSIGDYVLSGGEIAAMALIDACVRLIPGVMGKASLGARGELQRGPARIPAIHPAAGLGRPGNPGGARVRRPRQGRGVAAGGGRAADPRTPARPVGGASRAGLKSRQNGSIT